jgi:hypothetical protein
MPIGLRTDELRSPFHWPEQKVCPPGVGRFQTEIRTATDQVCSVPKTSVIRPDILSQTLPLPSPSCAVRPAKADT